MSFAQISATVAGVSFLLAGVTTLAFGTYFAAVAETSSAAVCLAAGVVLLFAANIDRFESIKGLGLEAKTRALERSIAQAEVTLAQLRELAELTGGAAIELESAVGRLGRAPSMEAAYRTSRRVEALLSKLGSNREVINVALSPWAQIAAFDVVDNVRRHVLKDLSAAATGFKNQRTVEYDARGESGEFQRLNELMSKTAQLGKKYEKGIDIAKPAVLAEVLRELVQRAGEIDASVQAIVSARVSPWVERLDYLSATLDLSDRAEWFAIRP